MELPINHNRMQIEKSDVYLSIFTDSFKSDERCMFELGLAIMLDKPLLLVVFDGTEVPENLMKIATIEHAKRNCKESIHKATEKLLKGYR